MNELNLSALSDRELIAYVEGRNLSALEKELLDRVRGLQDRIEAAIEEHDWNRGPT